MEIFQIGILIRLSKIAGAFAFHVAIRRTLLRAAKCCCRDQIRDPLWDVSCDTLIRNKKNTGDNVNNIILVKGFQDIV